MPNIFRIGNRIFSLFVILVLLSSMGFASSKELQQCNKYAVTANFKDVTKFKKYRGENASACSAIINNKILMTFYVFYASKKGNILNIKSIQDTLFEQTGAIRYPQPFFDKKHLFSSIDYLKNGMIVPGLFINNKKTNGFLFYAISEKRIIAVTFRSSSPVTNSEIIDAVELLNRTDTWFNKTIIVLIILTPFILLFGILIPNKYKNKFWRQVDQLRSYGMNSLFFILLLPAAILVSFWVFGFQTTGYSVTLSTTLLVSFVMVRNIYRTMRKHKLTLKNDGFPPFLLSSFDRKSTTTVMYAQVHESRARLLTTWVAHAQKCNKCKSSYIIYTPSREERNIKKGIGASERKLSQEELEEMVKSAISKTIPPINGCPKCHNNAHVSKEAIEKYNKKSRKDKKFAALFLGIGIAGTVLVHYLTSNGIIKTGFIMDSVKFISSWIPFSLQDSYVVGGSVIISTLYASFRLFLRKNDYGLWVCSNEDYIFENIDPSTDLEQICPSCNSVMIPIQDVKI